MKNKDLYQSEKQEDLKQGIRGGQEERVVRVFQDCATATVSLQNVTLKH